MPDNFLAAFQTGANLVQEAQNMRAKALNMQMVQQKMAQDQQTFPLELADLQNRHTLNMQMMQASRGGVAALGDVLESTPITDKSLPGKLFGLLKTNPGLDQIPAFKLALDTIGKNTAAELKATQLENQYLAALARIDAMNDRNADLKTKYELDLAEKTREFNQRMSAPPKATAAEKGLSNLKDAQEELQNATNTFMALPDDSPGKAAAQKRVQAAQTDVEYWTAKARGSQVSTETTTPEGVTTRTSVGGTFGANAPGVTGNIQTGLINRGLGAKVGVQEAKYANAMQLVNDLEHSLTAGDVGLIGNIKEFVAKSAGQIAPGFADQKTLMVRDKIDQLRAFAREIPEGGRETEAARREVLSSLPSTGLVESETSARVALAATRRLIQIRAEGYAEQVGQQPLVSQSANDIAKGYESFVSTIDGYVKQGFITSARALQLKTQEYERRKRALERFH